MFQFSELRKYLHQHPEVSGEEWQTSEYLKKYLKQFSPTSLIELADTGFALVFDSGNTGKTVLIRAELDALPIQEINDFAHKSQNEGISHKCGHDGHMAILCGVADKLNQQELGFGKAVLLFQPAEETGKGAKRVLEESSFQKLPKPDFVFSLHNIPKLPIGAILLKDDIFTASVKSWAIKLEGKTAHAASPEHGINPALAISELVQATQKLIQPNPEKTDFQLITPIHINMGELAYGISAGEATVHFTIRTWQNTQMRLLVAELENLLKTICQKHNLRFSSEWLEEFYANQNNPEAMAWLRTIAKKHQLNVQELSAPFKFGEDFGLFTTQFKGAMFGLGAGENHPELHNPDYDFPDEIAPIGIQIFESLIREITKSH